MKVRPSAIAALRPRGRGCVVLNLPSLIRALARSALARPAGLHPPTCGTRPSASAVRFDRCHRLPHGPDWLVTSTVAYNHRVTDSSPLVAGIVLVGGRSVRMGSAKASLEWHGSTLLQRTVGVVARAVDGPVLVVRAPGQGLPEPAAARQVVDDPVAGRGPLQGIATGLAAAAGRAAVAAVCAVDLPLLHPAFLRRRGAGGAGGRGARRRAAGRARSRPAARRRLPHGLAPRVAELVDAGTLRAADAVRAVPGADAGRGRAARGPGLAAADPRLESLPTSTRRPSTRRPGRARPPSVQVQCFGALATPVDTGPADGARGHAACGGGRGRGSPSTGRSSPWSRRSGRRRTRRRPRAPAARRRHRGVPAERRALLRLTSSIVEVLASLRGSRLSRTVGAARHTAATTPTERDGDTG